ncbi:MAG: diguanylate cyclase [Armatimonadetes bacterium]|nr:diguanylate cyclase [Armatimonadota bacterium]
MKFAILRLTCAFLVASAFLSFCLPSRASEENDLFKAGLDLQKKGKVDQAVSLYLAAVKKNPKHLPSLQSLCHILIVKGNPDRAYAFCTAAASLDSKNAALHNNLGILHTMRNQVDLAIESFKKAIRIAPDYAPPRENLAFLYSRLGIVDAAIEQYEKLAKLAPRSVSHRLAVAKLQLARGERKKAEEALSQALAISPDNMEANLLLADLLAARGDTQGALNLYDRLLRSNPESREAHMGRGKTLLTLKRWREARSEFAWVGSRAPNDLEARQLQLSAEQQVFEHQKRVLFIAIGASAVLIGIIVAFLFKKKGRQKVAETHLARDFGAKLKEPRDAEGTVGFILDYLSEYLECPHNAAFLTDHGRKRLTLSIQNLPARLQRDLPMAVEEVERMLAVKGCRPFTMAQLTRDLVYQFAFPKLRDRLKDLPVQLFVPLAQRGGRGERKLLALLALGTSDPKISKKMFRDIKEKKMPILTELIDVASDALEDLNLYLLSVQDELTRIFNKRAFLDRLTEELKKVEKYHQPCSLLMMDIDHFKDWNDRYGHPQGDIVLRDVAEQIRLSLREGIDILARYGGEEFAAILPATPEDAALSAAERTRERIANYKSGELPEEVTISIGIATYPTHARSDTQLVKLADIALYYSKRHGRNRCTPFSQIPDSERITADDSTVTRRDTSTDSLGRILPALAQAWERIQGEITKAARERYSVSFVAVAPRDDAQQNVPILLQAFKVIQENIRLLDFVVQHRGRYLILVLPEFGAEDVVEPAKELVDLLGKTPMGLHKDTRPFCAGIAVFPDYAIDPDRIVEACVRGLLQAQKGEERVVLVTDQAN